MATKKKAAAKAAREAARALGRRGGLKGGKARAAKLSPERRSEIARAAIRKRWGSPEAGGADVHTERPLLPPRPTQLERAASRERERALAILAFQDIHQTTDMSEAERARREEFRRMLLSGENPLRST